MKWLCSAGAWTGGIGVGEHGFSHGCGRRNSHLRMLLSGAEECTLMGVVTPLRFEGEGVFRIAKKSD